MLGPIVIVIVVVVAIPVGVLLSGGAAAAVLGAILRSNADATHPDSELINLNR